MAKGEPAPQLALHGGHSKPALVANSRCGGLRRLLESIRCARTSRNIRLFSNVAIDRITKALGGVLVGLLAVAGGNAVAQEPEPLMRPHLSVRTGFNAVDDFQPGGVFNVFFDRVEMAQSFTPGNVELMKQHVLFAGERSNTWQSGWRADGALAGFGMTAGDEVVGHWSPSPETLNAKMDESLRETLSTTKFATYTTLGLRYSRIESDFYFLGLGSILGRTSVDTQVDHHLIGPQIGVGAVAESDIWRFESVLLSTLGYQRIDYKQEGVFGEETIPGALNRPAVARTPTSAEEYGEEHVALLGELRLTASCRLSQHLRIDGGWRGALATQFHNASLATAWNAPDFGIRPRDGETLLYDYWTLGLTYEF